METDIAGVLNPVLWVKEELVFSLVSKLVCGLESALDPARKAVSEAVSLRLCSHSRSISLSRMSILNLHLDMNPNHQQSRSSIPSPCHHYHEARLVTMALGAPQV